MEDNFTENPVPDICENAHPQASASEVQATQPEEEKKDECSIPNIPDASKFSPHGADYTIGTKKGKVDSYARKFGFWVIATTVCLFFGILGSFLGISYLSKTVVVEEASWFELLILKSAGVNINRLDIDEISGNYTGDKIAVVEKIVKQCVEIRCTSESTGIKFGSGVILDRSPNGYYIITNQHVVFGADEIDVILWDDSVYYSSIIALDKTTDLAIIEIKTTRELSTAVLGVSANLKLAQDVIIIGNPLGGGLSVTSGMISAVSREITVNEETGAYIQTDAAINPGNSGGGMFDASGNLIGIVAAKLNTQNTTYENMGYAIPIDLVKTVADDLFKYGYVTGRSDLPFTALYINTAALYDQYCNELGLPVPVKPTDRELGYYITKSFSDNIKIGDFIRSINGVNILDEATYKSVLSNLKIGDKVTIVNQRFEDGHKDLHQYEITVVEKTAVDPFK